MRDFIVTLLVAFVLFRILKSFNSPTTSNQSGQKQNNVNDDGNITILNNKKTGKHSNTNEGDYVPYEEIKD